MQRSAVLSSKSVDIIQTMPRRGPGAQRNILPYLVHPFSYLNALDRRRVLYHPSPGTKHTRKCISGKYSSEVGEIQAVSSRTSDDRLVYKHNLSHNSMLQALHLSISLHAPASFKPRVDKDRNSLTRKSKTSGFEFRLQVQ